MFVVHTACFRHKDDAYGESYPCPPLASIWCLPLRSFLCKTAIRGRFANATAGKASSVFKMTASFWGYIRVPPTPPVPILHTVQYCSSQSVSRLTTASPNLQDLVSMSVPIVRHYPLKTLRVYLVPPASFFFCVPATLSFYTGHPCLQNCLHSRRLRYFDGYIRVSRCALLRQRERLVHWSYAYAYDAGCSEGEIV